MTTINRPVLLSLRPHFADLVFRRIKRAELRRRFAKFAKDREVLVYVSSPEQVLRGGFRISEVWQGNPSEIWKKVCNRAGIDRTVFDSYYEGSNVAYALDIADVWELPFPIPLETLKDQLSSFTVPQSWRYLKDDEKILIERMRTEQEIGNGDLSGIGVGSGAG